ncbi:MAG: WYL domain-containing protein [Planctomycetota bacterium]
MKTVRGYIHLLADVFQVEPLYEPQRHGYHYPEDTPQRLTPLLNEDEVAAIFLLDEATRALAGSPVEDVLVSVQQKLALMVPKRFELSLNDIAASLSLRRENAVESNGTTANLQTLFKAAMKRQRVECVYSGRARKRSTRRKLDPLHITRCEGQWYLIAYCHLRKDRRTFVPARMTELTILQEHFERPKGFNADEHFRSAFGVVAGVNVCPVALHFKSKVAQLIRERHWHTTQSLEELPGGDVRLRMKCSQSEELFAWLLSWGSDVRVEEPVELAELVAERHKEAAENYV